MTSDNLTRKKHTGEPGNGGQFGHDARDESAVSLTATPVNRFEDMHVSDIDKELAEHHGTLRQMRVPMWKAQDFLEEVAARQRRKERYPDAKSYDYDAWKYEDLETKVPKAEKVVADAEEKIAAYQAEFVKPINDEFERRGGWTRFYLVTSSGGGHVHKNTNCSTCNYRTEFIWLTDESGKDEDEIVATAGDGACTVCYKSAPVVDRNNPRPNPFEDPKVKAAREQRAEEKAARDAAKAAKGIAMPDGKPVLDDSGRPYATERAAETGALGDLGSMGHYEDHPWEERWLKSVAHVQVALAHKRGVSVEEIRTSWAKKMSDKAKRDSMGPVRAQQMLARMQIALGKANAIVDGWAAEGEK
jgi:hypothetical protein